MAVKTVTIQGRTFYRGKSKCVSCDRNVAFCWPSEIMMFWLGLCAECDAELCEDLPKPGQTTIKVIHFN